MKRGETIRNIFTAAAIGVAAATGIGAAPSGESRNGTVGKLDDFDKAVITVFAAEEILAVGLLGYRYSDGARRLEKQLWQYGVPGTNFVAVGMALSRMWGVV